MTTRETQPELTEGQDGITSLLDADPFEMLRHDDFREPIQELENLLSQSRRTFLLGAGCSVCAGLPMMDRLTKDVGERLEGSAKEILDSVQIAFKGNGRTTIEDFMSEIVDHISLAERRVLRRAENASSYIGQNQYSHNALQDALRDIKKAIATTIQKRDAEKHISTHRAFIRAVHGTLKSGKTAMAHQPVDYFTLNYDTLLEDALALERIPLSDGFAGGTTAWWNPDDYQDSRAHARLFKLHGSIDWSMCNGDIFPRRIRDGLIVAERNEHILIWPAATKYREAQRDPYAQLITYLRQSLRPANSTQSVLCICGYSFADEHINIEIERAMREATENLTLVILTSDPEPTGSVDAWTKMPEIRERVRVYADRGFFHGDVVRRSSHSLKWWKFEVFTQLLGGSR